MTKVKVIVDKVKEFFGKIVDGMKSDIHNLGTVLKIVKEFADSKYNGMIGFVKAVFAKIFRKKTDAVDGETVVTVEVEDAPVAE